LLALLSECQSFSELSGGAFDVTVQPLWNVYAAHFFGSASPSPQGPEPRAIAEALALVDWQGVDIAFRRISLARPGMGLTLNGIAQGYLTDRIADILRVNGCDRVLADMGRSEILLVGCRPDGQAWRIALTDPLASERVAVTLELADRCISTSGGYGTKFEATGRHHHLFDPMTGASAGHYIAVSVVAVSAMVADALSNSTLRDADGMQRAVARGLSGCPGPGDPSRRIAASAGRVISSRRWGEGERDSAGRTLSNCR